jgi:hypothetical protein
MSSEGSVAPRRKRPEAALVASGAVSGLAVRGSFAGPDGVPGMAPDGGLEIFPLVSIANLAAALPFEAASRLEKWEL